MLEAGGGAVRFANPDELKDFGSAVVDVVRVGEREALEERVFLGLRLMEGIEPIAEVAGGVEEMVEGGLMCVEGGRWKLTGRGRLVSNEVFGRLLEEQGVGSRE
jgi:oxygen-independent coproporphyrinogen-3 oxidase